MLSAWSGGMTIGRLARWRTSSRSLADSTLTSDASWLWESPPLMASLISASSVDLRWMVRWLAQDVFT